MKQGKGRERQREKARKERGGAKEDEARIRQERTRRGERGGWQER